MDKNKVVLFDIDYTLFDTAFFKESKLLKHKIYEEVIDVLDGLSKIAILGVYSEGDIDFQVNKIKETNIDRYFAKENTHVVLDKLSDLKIIFEKYKNKKTFLVDDKLHILHNVEQLFPDVFTIWVKRGPFAQSQTEIAGFKPDAEITNLGEVKSLILNT
ncbi:MAG: hypothetical protein HYW62_02580 [Candidatus Levybacteria bacterium]|nr:hypothetical protein [Candidatus Levybacteria bacterium]